MAVFFSVFAFTSLLIPSPMFPGNVLCAFIGEKISQYRGWLSAMFNGVFYGVILWATFLAISRRLESEK